MAEKRIGVLMLVLMLAGCVEGSRVVDTWGTVDSPGARQKNTCYVMVAIEGRVVEARAPLPLCAGDYTGRRARVSGWIFGDGTETGFHIIAIESEAPEPGALGREE